MALGQLQDKHSMTTTNYPGVKKTRLAIYVNKRGYQGSSPANSAFQERLRGRQAQSRGPSFRAERSRCRKAGPPRAGGGSPGTLRLQPPEARWGCEPLKQQHAVGMACRRYGAEDTASFRLVCILSSTSHCYSSEALKLRVLIPQEVFILAISQSKPLRLG